MIKSGIGVITNKREGKLYFFKSNNVNKRLADYKLQLSANCHHNLELQHDWNKLSSNHFDFEVKDIIDKNDELLDKTLNKYLNSADNLYKDVKNPKIFNKLFKYELRILFNELYSLIGKNQINPVFLNKLSIHNLGKNFYTQIKEDAENSIINGKVKIGDVEKLLDELISEIAKIKENEDELIKYLINIVGINGLNTNFKSKLNTLGIDYDKGFKIKEKIIDLINCHEIINISEIDSKIDELLDIEVINANKYKELLFKKLNSVIESDKFEMRLKSFNIDDNFANLVVSKYTNEIKTYKLQKDFDFEASINQDILDKKIDDLLKELDNIFCDADFQDELSKFLLNKDDADEIKLDLYEFIKSCSLDVLITLNESNLKKKVDTHILKNYSHVKNDVTKLRVKLLNDLESIDYDIYSQYLSNEQLDEIKTKIEDIIINNEIINTKFNYKIDELHALEKTTIKANFKSLVDYEIKVYNNRLDALRDELKIDLSKLCSDDSNSFLIIKLEEYGLPLSSYKEIIKEVTKLLDSNEVCTEGFNSKLEELTYFKENSLKSFIEAVLIDFKENIDIELNKLYEITGNDSLSDSFKHSLQFRGLNDNAGKKIISHVENSIVNGDLSNDLEDYIETCLNHLESIKNKSSQLLEDNVGYDAHNPLFINKLNKNNLDPDINGMNIKYNMDELIQSGEVNPKNFDYILNREINHEIYQKTNRLLNDVDNIIGLDEINESFLNRIKKFYLNEYDAKDIRFKVLNAIDKNEIEEFMVSEKIGALIQEMGNIRIQDLLIKRVNEFMGYESISYEFNQLLLSHDLDVSDAKKIKTNIITRINSGKINCDNLDDSINREIYLLDSFNVKKELKKLSADQIDLLVEKYSLSKFILFKSGKINKLVDNVKLSDLKRDLAVFGFSKYKLKYDYFDSVTPNFIFCKYCGSKIEFDAKFCEYCGKKLI